MWHNCDNRDTSRLFHYVTTHHSLSTAPWTRIYYSRAGLWLLYNALLYITLLEHRPSKVIMSGWKLSKREFSLVNFCGYKCSNIALVYFEKWLCFFIAIFRGETRHLHWLINHPQLHQKHPLLLYHANVCSLMFYSAF